MIDQLARIPRDAKGARDGEGGNGGNGVKRGRQREDRGRVGERGKGGEEVRGGGRTTPTASHDRTTPLFPIPPINNKRHSSKLQPIGHSP